MRGKGVRCGVELVLKDKATTEIYTEEMVGGGRGV